MSYLHRISSINGYAHALESHYEDITKVYVRTLAQSRCAKNGGFFLGQIRVLTWRYRKGGTL